VVRVARERLSWFKVGLLHGDGWSCKYGEPSFSLEVIAAFKGAEGER
jgi:hypothetical protein